LGGHLIELLDNNKIWQAIINFSLFYDKEFCMNRIRFARRMRCRSAAAKWRKQKVASYNSVNFEKFLKLDVARAAGEAFYI
jgi:hypothetical protein